MKRKILVPALCGAAVGALVATYFRNPAAAPAGNRATLFGRISIPWLRLDTALDGRWPFFFACVIGWVVFSLYWEAAAKTAAAAKTSESQASRGVHVFLVNVALLLEFLPVRGWGRFLPVSTAIMAAGLAVEAAGTFLAIWARRHLGRNWSGAIAIKVEHQLVHSGPYRLVRHPIYTGLLAMYIGPALVTGEWHALLGVALAAFAYRRKIRLEEATLDRAFGADYDAYRRRTWALAPWLF